MAELDPAIEQQLADMSDQDWRALSARVRQPTSSEQLKTIASQHLSPDRLSTFMAIVDPRKLADEHGNIDEAKVQAACSGPLFGAVESQQQQPQPHNWGQHSVAGGPSKQPGDDGRRELERRHGVKNEAPKLDQAIRPGASARAALERRYGKATK